MRITAIKINATKTLNTPLRDLPKGTTRELRQEIYETIWDLDRVLEGWDFIEGRQLRFYPSRPAHFERYTDH